MWLETWTTKYHWIYLYSNLCAKFLTWLSHKAHDLNALQLFVICLEMWPTFIIASNTNLTQYSHNRAQRTIQCDSPSQKIPLHHVILCNTCYEEYDYMTSYMHVTPTKNVTNAHKNMTISSQKTSSHIPRGMSHQQKYDLCQQYNTSAENMTTHSHMPRRIGIFFARAGQRKTRTPRPVKACPTCCRDRRYVQTTVYIHMTDVRSDSSVMTRPSHRARHPPLIHRQSFFGILWLEAVINGSHKMCILL